jgi:hypothetical protein
MKIVQCRQIRLFFRSLLTLASSRIGGSFSKKEHFDV